MSVDRLPRWLEFEQRPFPGCNMTISRGPVTVMFDSGFVAHAEDTVARAHALAAGAIDVVASTHWHADHVGGNAALQAVGTRVAASIRDAGALERRDPGCCESTRLNQPVAAYSVDVALEDGALLTDEGPTWQVVATPGHTPGHLCFWNEEEGVLLTGDAVTDYDAGWVDVAQHGPEAAAEAVRSVERLVDLAPRLLVPAHGPLPADASAALDAAHRRTSRLLGDLSDTLGYGARRIFAFALMVRDGIPVADLDAFLCEQPWLVDFAERLDVPAQDYADDLVRGMERAGAVTVGGGVMRAALSYTPVAPSFLYAARPDQWPPVS